MYSTALMQQMIKAMPRGQYPSINKANIESFEIIIPTNQQELLIEIEQYEQSISQARTIVSNCAFRKQSILDKYLK